MDKLFQIEPFEMFSTVCKDILNSLYQSQCDSTNMESVKEHIKDVIAKSDFNMDKVKETLQNNLYNKDKINYFIQMLEEKQSEILYSALNHHNSLHGETITNFDWNLKLVLGTNELKCHKFTLLQLICLTLNSKKQQTKCYDLTKAMVLKFIQALEEINGKQ